MVAIPSFPMPFEPVPCAVWLAHDGGLDAYGNQIITYPVKPDWEGLCVYSPANSYYPRTRDEIEEGRPYGDEVRICVFLPKTFSLDIREGIVAVYPADDAIISGKKWKVIGQPLSFSRANTPGDYSWFLEAGEHLG